MTRRVFKSLIWSLIVAVVLLGVVIQVLSSGYANGLIRVYAQDALTSQVGEPCTIAAIEGNPLGHYRVIGLRIGSLAAVDTITVRYSMSQLLLGKAVVDSLGLSGVTLHIAPQDGAESPNENWWASAPPLAFAVRRLSLSRGQAVIASSDLSVQNLNLAGAISADRQAYRLTLTRYRSTQFQPPLTVSNLTGLGVLRNGDLTLHDLALETPGSRVFLSGDITHLDAPVLALSVRADSLALSELASFGIVGLPDRRLAIDGQVHGSLDSLDVAAKVGLGTSQATADLQLRNGVLSWDARPMLKGFEPGVWTSFITVPLTFDFEGHTTGAADSTGVLTASVQGRFDHLKYEDAQFDSVGVSAGYDHGKSFVKLEGVGTTGKIRADLQAAPAQASGQGRVWVQNFNVARVPDAPSEIGRVSGTVDVTRDSVWHIDARLARAVVAGKAYTDIVLKGTYDGKRATASRWAVRLPGNLGRVGGQMRVDLGDARVLARGSFDGQLSLEPLLATTRYGQSFDFTGRLDARGTGLADLAGHIDLQGKLDGFGGGLDSLTVTADASGRDSTEVHARLFGAAGAVEVAGAVAREGPLDLTWSLSAAQPDTLAKVFDLPVGGGPLSLSGRMDGTWSNPIFTGTGSADSLVAFGVPLADVTMLAKWASPDSAAISLRVGHLAWADRGVNGVFLDATRYGHNSEFMVGSREDARDRFYTWGSLAETADGFRVVLDSLHVQADQVALFNEGPCRVAYSQSKGIQIGHFALVGPAGRIEARNHPDFKGTIEVTLHDLDLRPWAFLFRVPDVDGVLNGDLTLAGALSDPLISSELALKNGHYRGVGLSEVSGTVSYGQGRMLAEMTAQPNRGAPVKLQGSFPVGEAAGEDNALQLSVRSTGFDLSAIDSLVIPYGNVAGALAFDLGASGTFDKPVVTGSVSLDGGTLFLRALNQTFRNVSANVRVGKGRVVVTSLTLGKPQSGAKVSGNIDLAGFGASGWDLSLVMTDLQAVGLPELRAVMDGRVQLTGSPAQPRVSGKVSLKQGDVRLTDLVEGPGGGWDEEAFYNALRMQLRVTADRQVWIRDPDLQVELTGDVDVVKDGGGIRVYGSLSSRRGFYTFQNRRLRITSGEIQFEGHEGIDPTLDIRTETDQRLPGETQPVKIYVNVGGTLGYPDVSFSSDPVYDQSDILSMLVTGRSTRQIGGLFGSGTGGGPGIDVGDQALGLMLGVAANQLSRRLGNELGLDLVEVDLGGGNISRIRVGKYLSSRLFVSYAQDISSTGREIGLEYEMPHNLTIEALQTEVVQTETQNPHTRTNVGLFWKTEW